MGPRVSTVAYTREAVLRLVLTGMIGDNYISFRAMMIIFGHVCIIQYWAPVMGAPERNAVCCWCMTSYM